MHGRLLIFRNGRLPRGNLGKELLELVELGRILPALSEQVDLLLELVLSLFLRGRTKPTHRFAYEMHKKRPHFWLKHGFSGLKLRF